MGKLPHTEYRLTSKGRLAFEAYLAAWKALTQPKLNGRPALQAD
ncbi:MAG: transcriptional regulator [Planctomycetota bacterium]|nr:transcriptional regulator [Planctomycetota bacterium]